MDGAIKVARSSFVLLRVPSFVKAAGVIKEVPLLFVSLSRRTNVDYISLFTEMLRLRPAQPVITKILVNGLRPNRLDWAEHVPTSNTTPLVLDPVGTDRV